MLPDVVGNDTACRFRGSNLGTAWPAVKYLFIIHNPFCESSSSDEDAAINIVTLRKSPSGVKQEVNPI